MSAPSAPPPPEFSRPLAVGRIHGGLEIAVTASAQECAALAARLELPDIAALSCHFTLRPAGAKSFAARGELRASLTQICVVSGEPLAVALAERFDLVFVPEGEESEDFDLDAPDEFPYTNDQLDLGEACAEQLALALDPFPRKEGAELPSIATDDSANPFAALKKPE